MADVAEEKQLTVRMPADLHRRLKALAARQGKSVQEIVVGLSESYVRRYESSE